MNVHTEAIMHELRKASKIEGLTPEQVDAAKCIEMRVLIALNNMLRESARKVKT